MPQWNHTEYQPGETLRNPISGDFFAQEAIKGVPAALVRESIQNSLDASVGKPVRVSFGIGSVDKKTVAHWLGDLPWHLEAPDSGLRGKAWRDPQCHYVTIEDFNTHGLMGDPAQWRPEAGTKNDFYSFFRAEGYTDKGGDDRGRWGVGKTVFPRSSGANCFFGLTVTDDARPALMGRSVLKSHDLDGVRYRPDGNWGDTSDPDYPDLTLPVSDSDEIERFQNAFCLQRRHECGLSVVVPWRDSSITATTVTCAVISDYFFPILGGDLIVDVDDNGKRFRIDRGSFADVLGKVDESGDDDALVRLVRERMPLYQLAVWIHKEFTDEDILGTESPATGQPRWSEGMITDIVASAKKKLASDTPVCIRVRLPVTRKHESPVTSHFDVFFGPASDDRSREPTFIREGIIVTNAQGIKVSGHSVIVRITGGALNELLGEAENVAHTEWSADTSHFKDKYRYGKRCINFVREAAAQLIRLMYKDESEDDRELLLDLFYFVPPDDQPDPAAIEKKVRTPTRPGGAEPEAPFEPPARAPAGYRLTHVDRGFRLTPGERKLSPGDEIRVRVAYDNRVKNPIRAWDRADFVLSESLFEVELIGVELVSRDDNLLHVRVTNPEFEARVIGFDPRRDLLVRADLHRVEEEV